MVKHLFLMWIRVTHMLTMSTWLIVLQCPASFQFIKKRLIIRIITALKIHSYISWPSTLIVNNLIYIFLIIKKSSRSFFFHYEFYAKFLSFFLFLFFFATVPVIVVVNRNLRYYLVSKMKWRKSLVPPSCR